MKKFIFCILLVGLVFSKDSIGQIVWGGPGNAASEFSGGLNGWTTVGITCPGAIWVWKADGKADKGAYSSGSGSLGIQSASLANGAMVFDSDFYDNAGIANNLGKGPCPSPHAAELISPVINLTGKGALSIRFNQYFRNFVTKTQVAYSLDGGNSWSNPITFNQDIALNQATPRNDVKTISLKGATGTDKFRVKFIFDGDYYFWIIDDVQIISRPAHDMRVNRDWFAIAPNYLTPASQVEKFGFLADIENLGATPQSNVKLNMTIKTDPAGATVYTADQSYGTVKVDTVIENISFGGFTPPAKKEKYSATYTISADSTDNELSNNSINFKFEVTDSVFSKELLTTRVVRPGDGNWEAAEKHSWAYGNYYFMPKGAGLTAKSVSFGIGNASAIKGEQIFLKLYKWTDTNQNGTVEFGERKLVGLNLYDILGTEPTNQLIRVPLLDSNFENPPMLENNANYIMMIEFTPSKLGVDLLLFASENHDYGAMILNSIQMNAPRYAGILGINDPLEKEPYSTRGFGWDIVPVVRLNISTGSTNTKELDENNLIAVYPNPATSQFTLNLQLKENAEQLSITMIDMNGRVIEKRSMKNVINEQLSFEVSQLESGTYLLFINTSNGSAHKKVIIQH